jgi:hypothetical protein
MEKRNVDDQTFDSILSELAGTIEQLSKSQALYLDSQSERPFVDAFGIKQALLPGNLKKYGIRNMTLRAWHDLNRINAGTSDEDKIIFQNCQTIAFDAWSDIANASDLWERLLAEVVRPLKIKDLDLVFYLGDPGKMRFFQVDEILDIISEFSRFGRVTFVLDEMEAGKLWSLLNGKDQDPFVIEEIAEEWKSRFLMIFRTMTIHRLLIYSGTCAVSYSEEEKFVFVRRKLDPGIGIDKEARDNFIAGFSIGLLMRLEITRCIVLGLVALGVQEKKGAGMDRAVLLEYINQWIVKL